MSFVHLHLHTEHSVLDGNTKVNDVPRIAKELGQEAVGITDHGTLAAALKFWKAGQEYGIKTILGCESYITPDLELKEKETPTWHLVLLAQNEIGRQNLFALSEIGWTKGFYKKPRVDHSALQKHSEGIIALTACMAGEIARAIEKEDRDEALLALARYKQIYGDRLYVELQPGNTKELNSHLAELAHSLGVKTTVTVDSHYDHCTSKANEELLLIVQQVPSFKKSDLDRGKLMYSEAKKESNLINRLNKLWPNRNLRFDHHDLHIMSRDEVVDKMNRQGFDGNALADSTLEISERCTTVPFETGVNYLPNPFPEFQPDDYLRALVFEGLKAKGLDQDPIYIDRANEELEILKSMGFSVYFLIVWDIINEARTRNIYVGPGRGSAAGSLVAFSLRITSRDPIKRKLLFFRFIDPSRPDWPDIDMDFQHDRRDEMKDYVRDKYGEVLSISTFSQFRAKGLIRSVARALCVPLDEVNKACKKFETLEEYETSDQLKDFRAAHPEFLPIAKKFEGQVSGNGMHAAGVLIANRPMHQICHPRGTKIQTSNGLVNIEELDDDVHKVISFSKNSVKGRRIPYGIQTSSRKFDGTMVEVVAGGKVVEATENHVFVAKLSSYAEDKHIVYLMKKGKHWRVGRTKFTKVSGGKKKIRYSGIASRSSSEGADAAWILEVCDDVGEASLKEDFYSAKWGVSKTSFLDSTHRRNKYVKSGQLYAGVSKDRLFENHDSICKHYGYYERMLKSHGLSIDFPFWQKGQDNRLSPHLSTKICAINLIPELMLVPVLGADESTISWEPVKVRKSDFCGDVYSLEVDGYHTYFANGIGVHNCPIESRTDPEDKKNRVPVSAFDMDDSAEVGLIKFDFLGLKGLTVIHDCIDLIKERHGIDIDWENLETDDKKVLDELGRGNTVGVFQMESSAYRKLLVEMGVDSFDDLVASNALVRPGAYLTVAKDYINVKRGRKELTYPHPDVEEYLKDTYGTYIYQEQVMQMAVYLGGFTWPEANKLRKIIGKKRDVAEFGPFYAQWIAVAGEKVGEAKAEKIWKDFEKHAGYSFNLSHSDCYSYVGYVTAWLKYYYPLEFIYSLLKNEKKDTTKMTYLLEAKRMGIEILAPDVNLSQQEMSVDGEALRFGLGDIKGVGMAACKELMAKRPFTSWDDLQDRIVATKCNISVFEALTAVDAMATIENAPRNSEPEKNYQEYLNYPIELEAVASLGLDFINLEDFDDDEDTALVCAVVKSIKRTPTWIRIELEDMTGNTTCFGQMDNDLSNGEVVIALVGDKSMLGYTRVQGFKERLEQDDLSKFELFILDRGFESVARLYDFGLGGLMDEKSLVVPMAIRRVTTKKGKNMAFVHLTDGERIEKVVIFPDSWTKIHKYIEEYRPILVRLSYLKDGGKTVNADGIADAVDILNKKLIQIGEKENEK